MAYILIEDFKAGLDRRRPMSAAHQGTLHELTNAHVTPGGDIEKRKAFVGIHQLPAGTHGLASTPGGLMVFGSTPKPEGMPAELAYRELPPLTTGSALQRVLDVESFGDGEYAIGRFDDGAVTHYYKGERVAAWDSIMSDAADNAGVASALAAKINAAGVFTAEAEGSRLLVTGHTPEVDFARSADVTGPVDGQSIADTVVQISPAAGRYATLTFTAPEGAPPAPGLQDYYHIQVRVSQKMVLWTDLIVSTPLGRGLRVQAGWSSQDTAQGLVSAINQGTAAHGWSADNPAHGEVRLRSPERGHVYNEFSARYVIKLPEEPVPWIESLGQFSGGESPTDPGLPYVVAFDINGPFSSAVDYSITLEGQTFTVAAGQSGAGQIALTHKGKVYSAAKSLLFFSGFDEATGQPDPMRWHESPDTIGAGFIDMTMQSGGAERLVALGIYQGLLAAFSARSTHLWHMNADPAQNELAQTLVNVGTIAPASVIAYGDHDLFFLSGTGVRSLRARDSSNTASSVDIGTPIDALIRAHLAGLPAEDRERAIAAIEPESGRYWLAIGDKIYVFSHYPLYRIAAWSVYQAPGPVDAMAAHEGQLYLRCGDVIYLYGGPSGDDYDASPVTVQLPFLDNEKPATFKSVTGFDVDCEGEWDVSLLTDPNDTTQAHPVARGVEQMTYGAGNIGLALEATHFAPRLTCETPGYARLSSLAIHIVKTKEE